ncbi:MAG: mechanosensitive ion channel family protein [Planctomycetota bacterium]
MLDEVLNFIANAWRNDHAVLVSLLISLAILVGLALVRTAVVHMAKRRFPQDPAQLLGWKKNANYFLTALALVAIGLVWIGNFTQPLKYLALVSAVFWRLLASLTILICVALIRSAVIRLARRRYRQDPRRLFLWKKNANYFFAAVALAAIGLVWLTNIAALSTYLGLVSAALVFAMKDLVANMAAWLFILWRKPFEIGHRIEVNKVRGDVIDIRLFQFTLLELGNWVDADQSTGRIVHLPNAWVFKYETFNYEAEFDHIWNEIPVLITFESDWEKAKKLLEHILAVEAPTPGESVQAKVQASAERYLIHFRNLTPIVYVSTQDSGLLLTLRYMVSCRQRRGSTSRMWEAIMREFARHRDIDLAYPTVRHYSERLEGKRAVGGSSDASDAPPAAPGDAGTVPGPTASPAPPATSVPAAPASAPARAQDSGNIAQPPETV